VLSLLLAPYVGGLARIKKIGEQKSTFYLEIKKIGRSSSYENMNGIK
jgi:hypothetical protein